MPDPATPPEVAPPTPWKRYVMIGAPIVVAAAVFLFLNWDQFQIKGWINRLSNSDARVRREQLESLKAHEDTELVDRLLLEAVEDDDKTFDVRSSCANLLLSRQRLPMLEGAFAKGSVDTRGLILKAFSREQWFDKFVEDQGGVVEDTVRTWVKQGSATTRSHAIQLAVRLDMDDVMPEIRALLGAQQAPNVHPDIQRDTIIAAAGAAERFKDCGAIPRVMELARSHSHSLVRLRCMQVVDRTVFRESPAAICPEVVAPEAMGRLLEQALGDDDHTVRMGAMLILARKPAWAPDVTARLLESLSGNGNSAERRQALETLAALGDPAFLESFPRYFHDGAPEVRSSAARVASGIESMPYLGCLTGVLQDEVESDLMWMDAANALRGAAGAWVNLPPNLRTRPATDPGRWRKDLSALFTRGEVEGLTRGAFAEGWFRWWAARLELTPEQIDKAVAARGAFYAAKGSGDTEAAEKALDSAGVDVPGLFSYERGWLQSR